MGESKTDITFSQSLPARHGNFCCCLYQISLIFFRWKNVVYLSILNLSLLNIRIFLSKEFETMNHVPPLQKTRCKLACRINFPAETRLHNLPYINLVMCVCIFQSYYLQPDKMATVCGCLRDSDES